MSDCTVHDEDFTPDPFFIQGNNSVFHPVSIQKSFLVNTDSIIDCSRDFSAVVIHESRNISERIACQRSPHSCVVYQGADMVSSHHNVNLVPFTEVDRVLPVSDHQSMYYIHELYSTTHGDLVFVRVSLAYGLCQVDPTSIQLKLGNCTSNSPSFHRPSCHGDAVTVIVVPPTECIGNMVVLPVNDDFVMVDNQVKYMSFHATDIQMDTNRSGCEHMFTPSAKAVLRTRFKNKVPERSQSTPSMIPLRSSAQSQVQLVPTSGLDGVVEYTSEECLPIDTNCDLWIVALRFNETIANQTFSRTSEIMIQQSAKCDIIQFATPNITFTNSGVLRLYQRDPNLIVELDMNTSIPSLDTVRITLETEQGKKMLVRSFSVQNKLALYTNIHSPYFNDIYFCRTFDLGHPLCQNITSEPFIDRFIFNPHLWGITSGNFKVDISVMATVATYTGRQLMNQSVAIAISNTTAWINIQDLSTKETIQGTILIIPLIASVTIIVLLCVWKRYRHIKEHIDYQLIT